VQVTARRSVGTGNAVPLILASIYGQKTCDVSATVVAHSLAVPSNYGIVGLDGVSLKGGTSVDSYRSSDGPYSTATRGYDGNVASNGNITLIGSSQILGNASPGAGGSVLGGYVSGDTTALTQALSYPAPDAGTASTTNSDSSVAQYMTADNSFGVTGKTTIDFHAGVYYFKNFSATGGAIINANIDGPVTIYVTGNFTLTGGSSAYQNQPQNLRIVALNPSTNVTLTGNSDIYANVYAPLSSVAVIGTADFYGQVVGKTVALSGNGQIHIDDSMTSVKHRIVTVR
jgi:hypothetical protein